MRHRILLTGLLAALSASVVLVPARADESVAPVVDPTVGPLISGTSSYVDGAFAWTDYVYDDRGADTNGRSGGDVRYPPELQPNNVADLVQLQLRPAGDGMLSVTAVLETLTPDTAPLLGLALDRDSDAATGAASLPGSWVASEPLGMDTLLVLGTGGGHHLQAADGSWQETGPFPSFPVEVDVVANTLSATVPVPLAVEGVLRAVAVVGYEQGDASWLTGDAPVHDLAFVDDGWVSTPYLQGVTDAISGFVTGDGAYWQDGAQSAILAGAADAGEAVAEIDLAALHVGTTELATPEAGSFETFLYRSALDLGEGVQGEGNSAIYAGPYQPYLVRLPLNPRPGLPLVMYLHGSSQTHISAVNAAPYDPASRDPLLGQPNALYEFDAVVAWPLARGPQQWYDGAAEQDVLDVTDDVLARLELDRDRVMLAGLSMGGYGTFRLAQLYPDRWALAYADVGADRTGLAENLTALPLRFQNGAADYLVHVNQAIDTRTALETAGTVDYRSWILHKGHHQPGGALAECVYHDAFTRTRAVNPPHVRYTIDPTMFVDDRESGLRLVYDGAYWVSGMVPAGEGEGSVELRTQAYGVAAVAGDVTNTPYQNITEGRDYCDSNENVRTNDTWDEQARAIHLVDIEAKPLLEGELTRLSAVTLAADRAGVTTGSLHLTTDASTVLTLTGLRPGSVAALGDDVVRARGDGSASVRLAEGLNVVELRPAGRS